jgi:LmbE family N-acetylglucosaminyl deacetylase
MNQEMKFFGKRVCFIGAHPDDIEIGAGALLAHIKEQDKTEVLCVTLSDNQKNPALVNLVGEYYQAMETLGVKREEIILEKFETRRFPQLRQEILEFLFKLNRSYRPDMVFVHTRSDIHQDHQTTTEETLRAFRGVTVLGFDVLRSSYGFFPHFLVEVNERDVGCKISALAKYETYKSFYYFDPEITRSTMVRHGALAERPFAEGFDILRIIGRFTPQVGD